MYNVGWSRAEILPGQVRSSSIHAVPPTNELLMQLTDSFG